jgi:phospholipid transport system substrate-binding protein
VNGKSLIYDITIDNISIAANYRNQFNRVINNQGFDALMTDLKNKQQGLEASLGTAHGQ